MFLPFENFGYHTSFLEDTFSFSKFQFICASMKRVSASPKSHSDHQKWSGFNGQEPIQHSFEPHSYRAHQNTGYTEHRGIVGHTPIGNGHGKRVLPDSELPLAARDAQRCSHIDCLCQSSLNTSSCLEGCSSLLFVRCYEYYPLPAYVLLARLTNSG